MSQEYTLIRDIISDHSERMHNIKKYYPFFKLSEISFSQYKEGRYDILDMGYILMAVLRFFIEENNFHEKPVSYGEYADFMHELLVRDFELNINQDEEKELFGYIFDKLKNDGKPFSYTYFDPEAKKKRTIRTRLIDSKIAEDKVLYFITSDAVAFYLDTKEIKDESNITVAQVLLSKMISTRNFKGGAEVIVRINNEVSKLIARKNEILNVISYDVFAGVKLYEEFMNNTVKWFEEEQKLFKKNKELVDKALKSCESDAGYYAAMEDIYHLERELNRAMNKHSELLEACMALQGKTDEIIVNSKLNRIRSSFDFRKMLSELIRLDEPDKLEYYILPLLKLSVKKTFSLSLIDNMLTYKSDDTESAEKIKENQYEENYKYPDELEDDRIFENYKVFLNLLFEMITGLKSFDLASFNERLTDRLGIRALNSGDYYSFIVHLCQKKVYDISEILQKPETFLEEMICRIFEENREENQGDGTEINQYKTLSFEIEFSEDTIKIGDNETANIVFNKI